MGIRKLFSYAASFLPNFMRRDDVKPDPVLVEAREVLRDLIDFKVKFDGSKLKEDLGLLNCPVLGSKNFSSGLEAVLAMARSPEEYDRQRSIVFCLGPMKWALVTAADPDGSVRKELYGVAATLTNKPLRNRALESLVVYDGSGPAGSWVMGGEVREP